MAARIFVLIFILCSGVAEAFAFECTSDQMGNVIFAGPQVEQVYDVIENYEEAPFAFACKEKGALKDRPGTGLLMRSIPEADKSGHTAVGFFEKLIAKIDHRVTENENISNATKRCFTDRKSHPDCVQARQWVGKDLPEFVAETRYNLSLAQSPHQVRTWMGWASTGVNESMDTLGSYKEVNWAKLTPQEKKYSESILKEYADEIAANAAAQSIPKSKQSKFVDEAMIAARYRHYLKYHEMMSAIPFVQYISSSHPTEADVLQANVQFAENLKTERGVVNRFGKLLEDAKKGNGLSTDLFMALNYSSLVEETLLENPEYCAIATSLVYTGLNRQIGNAVAVGLPVLAVSFFAPPAAGIIAGLAAGGYTALESHNDLEAAKARAFSQFYADPNDGELDEVGHAYADRNLNMVLLPVGYGAAAAVTSRLGVRVGAAAVGLQVAGAVGRTSSKLATTTAASMKKAFSAAIPKK